MVLTPATCGDWPHSRRPPEFLRLRQRQRKGRVCAPANHRLCSSFRSGGRGGRGAHSMTPSRPGPSVHAPPPSPSLAHVSMLPHLLRPVGSCWGPCEIVTRLPWSGRQMGVPTVTAEEGPTLTSDLPAFVLVCVCMCTWVCVNTCGVCACVRTRVGVCTHVCACAHGCVRTHAGV